jgi:hypothetical protein
LVDTAGGALGTAFHHLAFHVQLLLRWALRRCRW